MRRYAEGIWSGTLLDDTPFVLLTWFLCAALSAAGVVHDSKPHNDEEEIPRCRSNFDCNSVDKRLATVSQAIEVEPDRMTKV